MHNLERHHIKKPIFIIGCPRSGTTLVMNILAQHKDLSWASNYLNRFPKYPVLSYLNRIYNLPTIGETAYSYAVSNRSKNRKITKFLPLPVEPWSFWNYYLANFQWERNTYTPARPRTAADISITEIKKIRKVISSIQKTQGRARFLSKYTDFPRISYLTQAFPDAIFIHIIRDGRAVAASYHKLIKNGIFRTWDEREWWIKGWPSSWQTKWYNEFRSPLSFAAFQWKFFVHIIRDEAQKIPTDQYIEIKYADVVKYPKATFNTILDYCELKQSESMELLLDEIPLVNMNYQWKDRYSQSEKEELDKVVYEPIYRKLFD